MRALVLTLVTAAVVLASCETESPLAESFDGDLRGEIGATPYKTRFKALAFESVGDAESEAVTLTRAAQTTIDAALSDLGRETLAEALIAAQDRGVRVRVVADIDRQQQAGFRRLEAAGIDVVYGDAGLLWSPQPALDIDRAGEDNRMTHSFLIADGTRMIALSGGFPAVGAAERPVTGFAAISEALARDFGDVFQQMHGGVFATTLTVYGASLSTDTNNATTYPTEDGIVEAYFGPAEPLAKHLIDEIYGARARVDIFAESLGNTRLVDVLRYKAEAGFPVRVVLAERARDDAFSVTDQLEAIFADVRARRGGETPFVRYVPDVGGALVLLDGADDRRGVYRIGKALTLTEGLLPAVPYERVDDEAISLPSASFTDASMWVVTEEPARGGPDYPDLRRWGNARLEAAR